MKSTERSEASSKGVLGIWPCELCPEIFDSEEERTEHRSCHVKYFVQTYQHGGQALVYDKDTININSSVYNTKKPSGPLDDKQPFSCILCGLKFKNASDLLHHRLQSHHDADPNRTEGMTMCQICWKESPSREAHEAHLQEHRDMKLLPSYEMKGRYTKLADAFWGSVELAKLEKAKLKAAKTSYNDTKPTGRETRKAKATAVTIKPTAMNASDFTPIKKFNKTPTNFIATTQTMSQSGNMIDLTRDTADLCSTDRYQLANPIPSQTYTSISSKQIPRTCEKKPSLVPIPCQCNYCGISFLDKSVCVTHKISKHPEYLRNNMFECPGCKERFPTGEMRDYHLCPSSNQCGPSKHKPKQNPADGHYSKRGVEMGKPARPDDMGKTNLLECTTCHLIFGTEKGLRYHELEAHGRSLPNYQCKHCVCVFQDLDEYTEHQKKTHAHQLFCTLCGADYTIYSAYCHHLIASHNLHQCTECLQVFGDEATLRKHVLSWHSKQDDAISCIVCGLAFPEYDELEEHIQQSHQAPATQHKTSLCDQSNASQEDIVDLTQDEGDFTNMHPNDDAHKESIASDNSTRSAEGRSTSRSTNTSISSHTQNEVEIVHPDSSLITDDCIVISNDPNATENKQPAMIAVHSEHLISDRFDITSYCETDEQLHTQNEEKPYLCSICLHTLGYKGSLRKHMKKQHSCHSVYLCSDCGVGFTDQPILKSHLLNDHPVLCSFSCHLCSKQFKFQSLLRHHVAFSHHRKRKRSNNDVDSQPESNQESLHSSESENVSQTEEIGGIKKDEHVTELGTCGVCIRGFRNPGGLMHHVMTQHKLKRMTFHGALQQV